MRTKARRGGRYTPPARAALRAAAHGWRLEDRGDGTVAAIGRWPDDLPAEIGLLLEDRDAANVDGACPECRATALRPRPRDDGRPVIWALVRHEPNCRLSDQSILALARERDADPKERRPSDADRGRKYGAPGH